MAANGTFQQIFIVTLLNGATTVNVVFPVQFLVVPFGLECQIVGSGGSNIFATPIGGSITTLGFSATFSAAIPDGSYTMTVTATAQQTTPGTPGSDCGCGSGVNNGVACQVPQIASYLFPGSQGIPGPTGAFVGPYNAAATYYRNAVLASIVSYAGYLFLANNTAKNGTATWGTPVINTGDWLVLGPVGSTPLTASNSYHATANIGGNSTVTTASSNHTEALNLTGSAGTRVFTLAASGNFAGDRATLVFSLPAVASINVQVLNGGVGAGQLLPTQRFAGNQVVTNGTAMLFTADFYFDGTNWNYASANLPA